jgi:hypothetical protein
MNSTSYPDCTLLHGASWRVHQVHAGASDLTLHMMFQAGRAAEKVLVLSPRHVG